MALWALAKMSSGGLGGLGRLGGGIHQSSSLGRFYYEVNETVASGRLPSAFPLLFQVRHSIEYLPTCSSQSLKTSEKRRDLRTSWFQISGPKIPRRDRLVPPDHQC